jgi:hypothetical protein
MRSLGQHFKIAENGVYALHREVIALKAVGYSLAMGAVGRCGMTQ